MLDNITTKLNKNLIAWAQKSKMAVSIVNVLDHVIDMRLGFHGLNITVMTEVAGQSIWLTK